MPVFNSEPKLTRQADTFGSHRYQDKSAVGPPTGHPGFTNQTTTIRLSYCNSTKTKSESISNTLFVFCIRADGMGPSASAWQSADSTAPRCECNPSSHESLIRGVCSGYTSNPTTFVYDRSLRFTATFSDPIPASINAAEMTHSGFSNSPSFTIHCRSFSIQSSEEGTILQSASSPLSAELKSRIVIHRGQIFLHSH
jgi:hypothetical protein